MIKKYVIPLYIDEVAPRFDLATEVLIIITSANNQIEEKRTIVLPGASSEKLCHLILTENINTVICGAIEDEYYQFLKWKKINVIDFVSGPWETAFSRLLDNSLHPGDMLHKSTVEGEYV